MSRVEFYHENVLIPARAAEEEALRDCGALVRRIAQKSLRQRNRPSPPGSPPSSRQGDLRNSILFRFDAARRSVLIGAPQFSGSRDDAPALHEFGGVRAFSRLRRGKPLRIVQRYRARPFMRPALDEAAPQFAAFWKGRIR